MQVWPVPIPTQTPAVLTAEQRARCAFVRWSLDARLPRYGDWCRSDDTPESLDVESERAES